MSGIAGRRRGLKAASSQPRTTETQDAQNRLGPRVDPWTIEALEDKSFPRTRVCCLRPNQRLPRNALQRSGSARVYAGCRCRALATNSD